MKYIFLLNVMLLVINGCGRFSDTQKITIEAEKGIVDTLNIVQQIDNYKKIVESNKTGMKSIRRDIYESSEGGFMELFYNEVDTLKKEIVYYGETGKREINIYQKTGKPILIEDKDIIYRDPIYVDNNVTIKDSITDVFYLDDDQKLIFWSKKDKKVSLSEYDKKQEEITLDYNY